MKSDTASILKQFEPIEQLYEELKSGRNGYPPARVEALYTMCLSCIERIVGKNSSYWERAQHSVGIRFATFSGQAPHLPGNAPLMYGVIQALKADIEAGHLSTLRELIHADVFSDLLETAEYFLNEDHKDPAAVMVGGVLEGHLRQLCYKNSIDTEEATARGPKPKKADTMNSDLSRDNLVYSKLEQKTVTAWLDLRNKAAHGEYDAYDKQQVALFLQGVRDFISRFPA